MTKQIKTFSPKLAKVSIAHSLFTTVFAFFVFRSATGELLLSLLFVVLISVPGTIAAAVTVTSSLRLDEGGSVSLSQLGRVRELGPLDGLSVLYPRLPFGVGVPRIIGPTETVRALPLTKAVFLEPSARMLFCEITEAARSTRGE